jgi:IstB-like ATP binding protein
VHRVVAALVAELAQGLVDTRQRQSLAPRFAGVRQEHSVELVPPRSELRSRLDGAGVPERRRLGADGDGRYSRLLRQIAKANLLILDDWCPEPLLPEQARDLLEVVEDRYDAGSTLITSQVPVDRWYEIIGIATLADAVLDRLLHNAHRIELAGESLRKRKAAEPAA